MGEYYNRKELKNRKQLRNESTAAEAVLWTRLKGSQLEGRKFRRQYSVENYILDFIVLLKISNRTGWTGAFYNRWFQA